MIADKLRAANIDVIEGRPGGRTSGVASVATVFADAAISVADTVNTVARPADASFVIEPSGRVWVLSNGPRHPTRDSTGVVVIADDEQPTEAAADALHVLMILLAEVYPDLPANDPGLPVSEPAADLGLPVNEPNPETGDDG